MFGVKSYVNSINYRQKEKLDNLPFFNPYESLEEQVFEQIGFFDRRKHGGRKTEELDVVVILKIKFKFANKTKVLSRKNV